MATIKQIKIGDVIHDINAVRLDIDTKGSTTQPVYFSEGKPVACTYELKKTVPSDAKFTDTTYTLNSFGITATAAELNKMDGVTATTAELNYVDGVTSNIQTQLNAKAAATTLSSHTENKSNPHGVTAAQVGLGNVENKSSATIRGELTKANVTTALGYTPPTKNTTYGVVSTTANGLAPKLAGGTAKYLRADGTWATPTNTKNTAGSTNSSSKLFLIGATSQASNPQTYSHDTAYVGTDGCLYSGSKKVLTGTTESALDSKGNTWYAMNTDAGILYVGCYHGTLNFSTASGGYYRPSAAIPFTPTTASFSNTSSIDLLHCYPISVDYCVISGSNGVHDCYISDWNEANNTFSVWPWGNTSKTVTVDLVVTLYNPRL